MIGFEMKASGSNGFKRSSGAWSEGSMIALKFVMSLPKVNPPGMGKTRRGMISAIESSFGKIKAILLRDVCSSGNNFTLFLTRDIKLKYFFDYSKKPERVQREFLHLLAKSEGEIGDQVMMHICRTIQDFQMHNITKNGDLTLTIDVDL